ncbi:MAG: hypothetical protein IRY94_14425 [Rhodospirillaceae bacterium]|nr:hypothetical protein [Rhodospirillaceae bacterium]
MSVASEPVPARRRRRRGAATPRLTWRRRAIFAGGVAILSALLADKLALGPTSQAWSLLLREDGLIETSEALYLLVAAAFALAGARRLRARAEPTLAVIYALAGLWLLFIGMEEISWGQRMFGVTPPEFFEENNAQAEITVHNLGPVQVLLDYAYFALGGAGALAWTVVPALERRLFAPERAASSARLLRALLWAAAGAGLAAVVAGLVMTPARVVALGLLRPDAGGPAAEATRRHLERLHDYRVAAAGAGMALVALAAATLVRFQAVWAYLAGRIDRLDRMLVPRWHLSIFFLPAFLYYAVHILFPHEVDAPEGLGGFLIQRDEEVAEFMLYIGWMIFFYLRFHYIGPVRKRRER